MNTAIVTAASSFRGIFIHGVLSAFEKLGFRAEAYAGASSLSIPSAYGAIGKINALGGIDYWKHRVHGVRENNFEMSKCIKIGIDLNFEDMAGGLFRADSSRLFIGVSEILTEEVVAQSSEEKSSTKLARQLMVASAKKDDSWMKENVAPRVFDTQAEGEFKLTENNLKEVMYATTRLLPAWKDPAVVNGKYFLDAVYTCGIPLFETAISGFEKIIVISAEPGPMFADMFCSRGIPERIQDTEILKIQPDFPLSQVGVEFLTATDDGLSKAFEHGFQKGETFLNKVLLQK